MWTSYVFRLSRSYYTQALPYHHHSSVITDVTFASRNRVAKAPRNWQHAVPCRNIFASTLKQLNYYQTYPTSLISIFFRPFKSKFLLFILKLPAFADISSRANGSKGSMSNCGIPFENSKWIFLACCVTHSVSWSVGKLLEHGWIYEAGNYNTIINLTTR